MNRVHHRTALMLMSIMFWAVISIPAYGEDLNGTHGQFVGENNDVIDMFTGTLNVSQNDLTLPGRNGLDIVITRTYSSDIQADPNPDQYSTDPVWGAANPYEFFGPGWHWTPFRIQCKEYIDTVVVHWPDGSITTDYYHRHIDTLHYGNGSAEELFNDYPADTLGRYKSRQFALFSHHDSLTADTMFTLDGTKVVFTSNYRFNNNEALRRAYGGKHVRQIINSHQDSITFEYHSNTPLVRWIKDSVGRFVCFEYNDSTTLNTDTRLLRIKYKNWKDSTITVSYFYSGSNNDLVKVGYPSGDTIRYAYTTTAYWNGSYRYIGGGYSRLSQITQPYGGKITYDWGVWQQWKYRIVEIVPDMFPIVCTNCGSCPECCDEPGEAPPCTTGWYQNGSHEVWHEYHTWKCSPRFKTRLWTDTSGDTVKFNYNYAVGNCGDDNNFSTILYPDSSYQIYWHTAFRDTTNGQHCGYDGNDNILFIQNTYARYPGYVPRSNDDAYDKSWHVSPFAGYGLSRDDISTPRIGTDLRGQPVYTSAINHSWTDYKNWELFTSFEQRRFDPHTGTFAVKSSNGIYDSTSGVWNNLRNQYFPAYKYTVDGTGSYYDSTRTILVWDYQESEIDTVKKIYGNDTLVTSFTYDQYGNQESVRDAQGFVVNYEYGADYNSAFLTRMYSPAYGNFLQTRYFFNVGAESCQVSPNMDTTYSYYDGANRLIKTKRPLETGDYSTQRIYDDVNKRTLNLLRINAADVRQSQSYFNKFNWPIRTQLYEQTENITSDVEYDNMGRICRTTRPYKAIGDTVWTRVIYDGLGRKIKILYPDGTSDSTAYTPKSIETIDKLRRKTKTILDNYFRVQKVFSDSAYTDSTFLEYGPGGKVIKETDPSGLVKKYRYDKYGRLYSDSSADGQKYYYYDRGNNLRLTRESPSASLWRYVKYDSLGRQLEIGVKLNADTTQVNNRTYPTGDTIYIKYKYDAYSSGFAPSPADSAHYNSRMNLTEVEDQSGKSWLYYDNRNRLYHKKAYISGLADTVDIYYNYDSADQLVKLTYPDSSEVNYKYYKGGNLGEITGFIQKPGDFGIQYKPWGAVQSMTFFNDTSYTDAYSYDSLTTYLTRIYSRKGGTKFWGQTYEYDAVGNITRNFGLSQSGTPAYTDTLGVHAYDYNYLLKQSRVKSTQAAKTLMYGYDNNGNRRYETVDTSTKNYYYLPDTLCQYDSTVAFVLVTCDEEFPVTDSVAFTPATLDTVFWSCTINLKPRMSFKIWSADGVYVSRSTTGSGFFVPSSLATIFVKARCNDIMSGMVNGTVWYHADSLSTVANSNKLGHISGQNRYNYTYDAAGRLVGDAAAGKEYVYNALGQLVTYRKDGHNRIFFDYDYQGHLVKKTVVRGNLCDRPDSSNAGTVCDSLPRDSCAVGDPNSGYVAGDANNNGIFNGLDPTYLSNWLRGQGTLAAPRSRADANCNGAVNGIDVTYMFNYFKGGPMVWCCFWDSSYTVSTYYIYSGEQIIAEYTSAGALDYNYVYGLGQRLAKYKGTEKYLYHNDHLGSLRAVTSQLGSVIGSQDYYPYGEKLALTGSPGKYAYNQKEYLDDWGFDLYYYGARFMDPVTGRFLTPDPVKDYLNPYSYVGNNPLNRIDPTGMNSMDFAKLDPLIQESALPLFLPDLPREVAFAIIWEGMTPLARIKTALQVAYDHEYDMSISNGISEIERAVYSQNADNLFYLLDSGNYDVNDSKVPLNADAVTKPEYNKEGQWVSSFVYFSSSAVDNSVGILAGIAIHEATHITYSQWKGQSPDPEIDPWGAAIYTFKTEVFARGYEMQYYLADYQFLRGQSIDTDFWVKQVNSGRSILDTSVDWFKRNFSDTWYNYIRKIWRP